jgi:hypothetical protein
MRLAERALREENTPVSVLAGQLGYTSESAFSNAFKRNRQRPQALPNHCAVGVQQSPIVENHPPSSQSLLFPSPSMGEDRR